MKLFIKHDTRFIVKKKEKINPKDCKHKFYNVYKGDFVSGRRCSICGLQQWLPYENK